MNRSGLKAVRRAWLALLFMMVYSAQASDDWPRMVESADGVSISYQVHGSGEPTLVLVHGWSCDGRYWRAQARHFARQHRVVVIDLAGHGHSGLARENYTMAAFGEDVRAVVEDVGAEQVILIGHSMGGPVTAEAARLMPGKVIGLIGVDTFQNLSSVMSAEQWGEFLNPMRADFAANAPRFVAGMFAPSTDIELRDWIIADMSAAPPQVAMSAMEAMARDYISGHSLEVLQSLEMPLIAINTDGWPTDIEGNQKQVPGFNAVIIEEADHFLHMAMPDRFNRELEGVIASLTVGSQDGQ
jgi:pimeloyl-ACP methyl ester carboxylesterase